MSSVANKPPPPKYWRSLAEREADPAFEKALHGEFAEPVEQAPSSPERRRFLQITGAASALASATGCRWQEDHMLPYGRRPEGVIPGEPLFFNTTMEFQGAGVGLRVKSYDGRPIKIEGNPDHPDSLGASGVFHQASLLELYDPDRSKTVLSGSQPSDWAAFTVFLGQHTQQLGAARGRGLRILAGCSSSPTLAHLRRRLLEKYPEAKWYDYDPVSDYNLAAGSRLAFGEAYRPLYHLDQAQVVVALDADLLGEGPDALRNARAFSKTRNPEQGKLSRLYSLESSVSPTGTVADHRLPVRKGHIKAILAALDASVTEAVSAPAEFGVGQQVPPARVLQRPEVKKLLGALVADLVAHPGKSLIVVGPQQPPEVHAAAYRLNVLLGNVGSTLTWLPWPQAPSQAPAEALGELTREMQSGAVTTLVSLDVNPVYAAARDIPFAEAMGRVRTSIHLGLFVDETARRSSWHLPLAHFLESWGDARATDGTLGLTQPLIAPLYGGKSAIELCGLLLRTAQPAVTLLRQSHPDSLSDERVWRQAVHDGVLAASAFSPVQPVLNSARPFEFSAAELDDDVATGDNLELSLIADRKVFDGRFANNGWLQELPDPVTKITWDNVLLVSPKTARQLGVDDCSLVVLEQGDTSVTLPAVMTPGQAAGSLTLALGYGRSAAGRVGGDTSAEEVVPPVGVNAYQFRSSENWHFASGVSLKPTGKKVKLATTQDKHAIDRAGANEIQARLPELIREGTLAEYKATPDFAKHRVHHPPLLSLWEEPVQYQGYKWGMTIDLNKCNGCSACMIACQAENNVPVVGKKAVLMGREMHWIRIDRFFKGDPENPEVRLQPVTCQQCEHAPCESVCPVGATQHSSEGLNDMAYNRCIGTRYCSNNCPYKVRRFNYFNFHEELKEPRNDVKEMVFNPEVTVRFRGVMEKCTYCVQRIQKAKIVAKNEERRLVDGEVTAACQQACPSDAISFGDLNDPASSVKRSQDLPRAYALLAELNVRPRTLYLAAVKNPHPELIEHETDGNHH